MNAQKIRETFLDFFRDRDHTVVPSDGLIPAADPTLLFTSAGMVQFKPLWTDAPLEFKRAASVQKCLRVGGKQSDLENVGKTLRHHTFFEMLGNFSFGDYFKQEAIDWAWEFVIGVMRLERENLWVSVFQDDDEAFDLWRRRAGLPAEKIVRLGEKDNFWGPAGNEGPCGPCSEIYFDRGPEWGCGKRDCRPGCDCERFIEFWNLVFPQFYQEEAGTRRVLERRGIDTGMGLERLALLAQGAESNYATDLFVPIIAEIGAVASLPYDRDSRAPYHAIADHIRALTFTISENILPSNEGRGYIVRRLLRRAARFGRKLGLEQPFLYRLVPTVVGAMQTAYPELLERREHVSRIVQAEEERFGETLSTGLNLLDEIAERLRRRGEKVIPGTEVFRLSDTYGFPPELTEEVAVEQDLAIDWPGFREQLELQRRRGRTAWKGMAENEVVPAYRRLAEELGQVEFAGYETLEFPARITAVLVDGEPAEAAGEGSLAEIVLDRSPFYAEAGGQVGDTGVIRGPAGRAEVLDTIRPLEGLVVHKVRVISGTISADEQAEAIVDGQRRRHIQRHHTATHLLQHALREVVGDHISQAGSYVCPDYFRFDFTHFEALSPQQLDSVQRRVNEMIRDDNEVVTSLLPQEEARRSGALAFFGEKYGQTVRVVDVGGYSREFCGGCHVGRTGEIGLFLARSDSSSAAGIRRIEGVCGAKALDEALAARATLGGICAGLKVSPDGIISRFEKLSRRVRELEKEIEGVLREQALADTSQLLEGTRQVAGIKLLTANLGSLDIKSLRGVADDLKGRIGSGIAVLGAAGGGKVGLVAVVTPDLTEQGWRAGDIIREAARLVGGSGGGRADLAQAGGKDPGKLPEALEAVPGILEKLAETLRP